jgi:predicted helicase
MLISDIDNKSYSDLYSQTISYGLFAARYHDPSLPTFSREEALKLIPRSNPFLRKLFKDISDDELDSRLVWIVDELVSVFLASDVASIMKDFGKSTKQEDPVVHFYETFLGAYNPSLKKQRGVWFTPQPVVNFIVRAVDDILKTEFGFKEGLADSSKKKIKVNYQGKEIEREVHVVQVLDPATGTGTFLSETIKHIHKNYEGMEGIWSKYVEEDLIPRINGFEILMASYAMAHLKLDMLLTDTGYVPTKDQRLKVFLTNSLEEPHSDSGTLWGNLLSDESDQANDVKRDSPVMCVIGNPPYSGTSSNMSKWIMELIEEYKDEEELKRRGRRWVQDDYVKFVRFGQHHIEKNGTGILAFINPHGFLDNPTFSGMRYHLIKSFDKIYTIDLHGNSNKKEVSPDGTPDINVFDIQQGVSINIFIKTGEKKSNSFGQVFHFDLYGKREYKYDFLLQNNLKSIPFNNIKLESPSYFFIPMKNDSKDEYLRGIKVEELFTLNTSGIVTAIDKLSLFMSTTDLEKTTKSILLSENPYVEFGIKDALQSSKEQRIEELRSVSDSKPTFINYRPFDKRCMYYTKKTHGWINSPRYNVMKHFILGENIGLVIPKINKEENCFFISNKIIGHKLCSAYDTNSLFPLYLYPENKGQQGIEQTIKRTPNLNHQIVKELSDILGLVFTNEKETKKNTFSPIDILDYIYGVLHSPTYREKYKEFLKIDFPRVPYPKDQDTFWKIIKLGGEIRQVHLLESPVVDKPISKYPITGTNVVGKTKYQDGKVYINDTQYFEDVPEVSWNFYIGGYQPAQKWLKDRKDRELQVEDIRHYLKIIVALSETDRLMKEIDSIEIE